MRALRTDAVLAPLAADGRLDRALTLGYPVMVFQPIMDLASGIVAGYEALARFPHLDVPGPDVAFAQAHLVGRGQDLEILAVAKALEAGAERPAGTILSLNVSPSTLLNRDFLDVLPDDLDGLQFEVTEHEKIVDQTHVLASLARLRRRGAVIAIDDVGEGYAGLQQLMALEPDVLKLDRSLVERVCDHPAKAALIEGITGFARRTNTRVCAEGVEQLDELHTLANLDVTQAQGWVIGRPETTFEDAADPAQAACAEALRMTLEVGDPTDTGEPDLAGVLARLATTETLDELARLMSWVAALVGCAKTELSTYDETAGFVEAVMPNAWIPEGERYQIGQFPLTQGVLERNVVAQVVVGARGADAAESRFLRDEGFGSLLLVPVYSRSRPVGLLEAYHTQHLPWTRHQIRRMRCVAAVTGPVLANLLAR